jgi:hypothetical protein
MQRTNYMGESKKGREISVYLKSDVGSTERNGRYKHLYQVFSLAFEKR